MKTAILVLISFLIASCASSPPKAPLTASEFATLLQNAKTSIDKAKSVGGEWADSRRLLEEAKSAAESGDMIKAEKLATLAKEQGRLGYEQTINQKNAGPWLF